MGVGAVDGGLGFTDALARTGVTRSCLLDLLRANVVRASVAETTGRGVHRRFSRADLDRIRLAADLRRLGLATRRVGELLDAVDHGRLRRWLAAGPEHWIKEHRSTLRRKEIYTAK